MILDLNVVLNIIQSGIDEEGAIRWIQGKETSEMHLKLEKFSSFL